jgi:hypothetical protein
MELDQILNLAEAVLWFAIALILFLRAKRSVPNRMLMRISAAAFFVFGLSDLVEMVTRAWYQPLGLFLLKAVCVMTLIGCLVAYRRTRVSPNRSNHTLHQTPAGAGDLKRSIR